MMFDSFALFLVSGLVGVFSFLILVLLLYGIIGHTSGSGKGTESVSGLDMRGTYTSKQGHVYEGVFLNGKVTGHLHVRLANGDEYDGDVVEGRFQGQGTYRNHNGDLYRGSFHDGIGYGKFHVEYADGRIYDGDVRNNVADGRGSLRFPDGRRYEGYFSPEKTCYGTMNAPGEKPYKCMRTPDNMFLRM